MLPWWGWMLAGMAVQDVAAVGLLYAMGYRVDWEAVQDAWTDWRSGSGTT